MLGIDVPDELVAQWVLWFAPERQPFVVACDDELAGSTDAGLTPELRDTFELYVVPAGQRLAWLTEAEFMLLPRADRSRLVRAQIHHERAVVPSVRAWVSRVGNRVRAQADGHRFVWWPPLVAGHERTVLFDYVREGRRPSQHHQVPRSIWTASERLLPAARSLAGSFPPASGPNCFGAVMAAAGIEGAEHQWMQREPFEQWLAAATVAGGTTAEPGTVLVWRSRDGAAQHAAVTLGGGWALHKPSQGWMSPTKVLKVPEVIASARAHGRRLSRRRIVP